MIPLFGVMGVLGVIACLVWAIVSKLRGGNAKIPLLWAAVCFALVVLMVSLDTEEASEPPPDVPEAVSAEPVPDSGETPSEAVTEPEAEPQDDAITLVARERGFYGERLTMNEETFFIYRLPGGVYRVTNAGKYPTQVNVYKSIRRNAETGFDEYTAVGDVVWMDVGGSGEITVPEGWFIEIHEPTKITLVRTGDAPKPEPVQESEPEPAPMEEAPEPEKAVQSPESIVEFLNTMYSELGMQNYTVSYDDGAFVINLWEPGLTGIATRMANGGEDIPEDLTAQYETWTQTATSLSDSAHRLVTEAGRDEDVKVFILNEWNRDNVIFCAINGVVFYDIGRGITW